MIELRRKNNTNKLNPILINLGYDLPSVMDSLAIIYSPDNNYDKYHFELKIINSLAKNIVLFAPKSELINLTGTCKDLSLDKTKIVVVDDSGFQKPERAAKRAALRFESFCQVDKNAIISDEHIIGDILLETGNIGYFNIHTFDFNERLIKLINNIFYLSDLNGNNPDVFVDILTSGNCMMNTISEICNVFGQFSSHLITNVKYIKTDIKKAIISVFYFPKNDLSTNPYQR